MQPFYLYMVADIVWRTTVTVLLMLLTIKVYRQNALIEFLMKINNIAANQLYDAVNNQREIAMRITNFEKKSSKKRSQKK